MIETTAPRRAPIAGTPAALTLELARLRELERLVRQLLVGGHVAADGTVTLSVTMPIAEWEELIQLLPMAG